MRTFGTLERTDTAGPVPVDARPAIDGLSHRGDGVAVLDKAVDLLECLADGATWSVAEAAAATGVTRPAAYRILGTLERRDWVARQQGARGYVLGPSLRGLVRSGPQREELLQVARPVMRRLWETCGETVNLGVMVDGRVLYLDMVETEQRLRMTSLVGSEDQLHSTALGKAMLACLGDAEVRRILTGSDRPQRTPHTRVSLVDLLADIAAARTQGYAVDDEENELGARCVAAAVRSSDGRPVAAVSIAAPAQRLAASGFPNIGDSLRVACAEIEAALSVRGDGRAPSGGTASPSGTAPT